jgi:hypothetical protein
MRKNAMRAFVLAGFAAVLLAARPAQSHASWVLTLEDVNTATTLTFSGAGPGGAVLATPGAGFNFTVSAGIGDASATVGPSTTFTLGFNSFDVNNLGATTDTLIATLKDTGVNSPIAPLTVSSSLSDTLLTGVGSKVSFETLVGATNSTTVSLTTFPGAVSSPTYVIPSITTPYTVENITTIKLGGSGIANETGTSQVAGPSNPRFVPEPATLTLAAFGFASCGVFLRRRKTKTQG